MEDSWVFFFNEKHAYPSEATEVCRQEEGGTDVVHPENLRSGTWDYQRRYLKWRFAANKYNINKKPNSRNRLRQKRFNWDNLLNRWADFRYAPNNSVSSWTKAREKLKSMSLHWSLTTKLRMHTAQAVSNVDNDSTVT